jgi:glucose-6-phosphate-specific signal transduction histidine kinase
MVPFLNSPVIVVCECYLMIQSKSVNDTNVNVWLSVCSITPSQSTNFCSYFIMQLTKQKSIEYALTHSLTSNIYVCVNLLLWMFVQIYYQYQWTLSKLSPIRKDITKETAHLIWQFTWFSFAIECTRRVSGITFIRYTQSLDMKDKYFENKLSLGSLRKTNVFHPQSKHVFQNHLAF